MANTIKCSKCKAPFKVSLAAHLLRTKGDSTSGGLLSSQGKSAKAKRVKKGCLSGRPGKKPGCKVTPRVTTAGYRLATEGHPPSGGVLSTVGKGEKAGRLKRGCLAGKPGTFRLSAAQKKKLPPAMQKGIIARQRRLGKKILG